MTIRFHRNLHWTDCAEGALEELFDPRVNQVHGASEVVPFNELITDDFLIQLREVYTLEAIRDHPHWFFSRLEVPGSLQQILDKLDECGQLHYAMFVWVSYDGNIYGYIPSSTSDWQRKLLYSAAGQQVNEENFTSWKDACWNVLENYDDDPMQTIFTGNQPDLVTLGFKLVKFMLGQTFAYNRSSGDFVGVPELLSYESFDVKVYPYNNEVYIENIRQRQGVVNRNRLYRVMEYSARATTAIAESIVHKKKRGDKELPTTRGELLYGIELELATDHSVRTMIDSQEFPFFICKQDSSISGRGSGHMECVTVPMDYRAQRKAWGQFFGKFWSTDHYQGFDTSTQTNNGMHIHMTKSAFEATPGHLKRFAWMICKPEHLDFITYLSERGPSLNSFCRMPTFANIHNTNKKKYNALLATLANNGRGAIAVNTSSGRTIEVRLFKGIVSYASLLKNLEFCDALYYYTQAMPYSKLTLESFVAWLRNEMNDFKPPREYKALKLFIDKVPQGIWNLPETRAKLAAASNPAGIVKVLNEIQAEPDDYTQNLVSKRLDRMGIYGENLIYYGKSGWTLKESHRDKGSKLDDYEAQLNPFVSKFKKAA